MSQENVEIVRAMAAAYNRGDLEAMLEAYDPAVEFVTLLQGTRHGKDGLRVLYEENRETLSGYRLEPDEVIDAGGDKVVLVARMGGAGRVSEIGLGDRIAFLVKFRNGLVVRQETFRSKDAALEAAGLSE